MISASLKPFVVDVSAQASSGSPTLRSLSVFPFYCSTMSHVGLAAASLVAGAPVHPISVHIPFTDEEEAMATPMEPALEALLRQVILHEDVV